MESGLITVPDARRKSVVAGYGNAPKRLISSMVSAMMLRKRPSNFPVESDQT